MRLGEPTDAVDELSDATVQIRRSARWPMGSRSSDATVQFQAIGRRLLR